VKICVSSGLKTRGRGNISDLEGKVFLSAFIFMFVMEEGGSRAENYPKQGGMTQQTESSCE
jgi:hypothetical protein